MDGAQDRQDRAIRDIGYCLSWLEAIRERLHEMRADELKHDATYLKVGQAREWLRQAGERIGARI